MGLGVPPKSAFSTGTSESFEATSTRVLFARVLVLSGLILLQGRINILIDASAEGLVKHRDEESGCVILTCFPVDKRQELTAASV